MAELKTQKTEIPIKDFIASIKDEQKRKDSQALVKMMEKATGSKAKMWGPSIIGFGDHRLKYESGRELDWFKIGFSPRKQNLALYSLSGNFENETLMKKLGKHKTGKGCLYLNSLEDIDTAVLQKMMDTSAKNKS